MYDWENSSHELGFLVLKEDYKRNQIYNTQTAQPYIHPRMMVMALRAPIHRQHRSLISELVGLASSSFAEGALCHTR